MNKYCLNQTNTNNKIKQNIFPMPFQDENGMQNTMSLKVTHIFPFWMKIILSL